MTMWWLVLVGLGLIMMLMTAAAWCLDHWEQAEITRQDEERRRLDRIIKANHQPKAPGLHSRRIS